MDEAAGVDNKARVRARLSFSLTLNLFSFFLLKQRQETVKTRMQVTGYGIVPTVKEIVTNEGIAAFWKGLPFAYGRELSYTSIKLGAYAPVRDALGAGKDAPFYLKFLAGAITGGVGSFVGNPFDVMVCFDFGRYYYCAWREALASVWPLSFSRHRISISPPLLLVENTCSNKQGIASSLDELGSTNVS